ncbi:MAG: ABC transporter ATP-binding protein [Deltaproteobacteria bacterium]|nr:MAG: ABC transporter ATP-binding protein [Deltaproteobacteria bacterium]
MDQRRLLINLENIDFAFPGGEPVLKDVSFQLREGERIGLIGPNGSGKTSLFHVIMGLLKPESGRIEIFGKTVENESHFRAVRQKIGLLFQDPDDQLFSPTVLEDVAFGPLNQGKSIAEAKKIARDTLESLGLSDVEDRITYRMSGGEKRLVSLATVLAMKPQVLLLDEPTTGLDMETTEKMKGILTSLDLSYVFISHDMDFIAQTTDKLYGMINGRIVPGDETALHTHIHTHGFGRLAHSHSHAGMLTENPR